LYSSELTGNDSSSNRDTSSIKKNEAKRERQKETERTARPFPSSGGPAPSGDG
jgi:hypothetical protein